MLSNKLGLRSWIRQATYHRPLFSRLRYAAETYPRTLSTSVASTPIAPETSGSDTHEPTKSEGWFYLDSVFPIRLGTWDFRPYIALFQEEALVSKIVRIFREVDAHGFEVEKVDPRIKDGGIFVNFKYTPMPSRSDSTKSATDAPDPALVEIEQTLLKNIDSNGGLPSWLGLTHGRLWRVRGKPWREDMRRYASPILRVTFEGPAVGDEQLWDILRPYGRIRDMKSSPSTPSTPRYATVTFERTASATIAHNCVYGAYVPPNIKDLANLTRLSTAYERPIKPHVIRDWLASHPKIVFPIVVFLLGTLTYTVFDPIRAVAVQAKVMDWFDYRGDYIRITWLSPLIYGNLSFAEFAFTKWLRHNTLDIFTKGFGGQSDQETEGVTNTTIWKDRQEAEFTLNGYLTDYPSTITFVHGPAGSGKSRLLRSVLEKADRRTLVIDCADIYAGGSDTAMVTTLAEQTGYWPIFTFLNSVNNLIDVASVGMIGQKAGLSSSLEDQVTQLLEVVEQGLRRVSASRRKEAEHRIKHAQEEEHAAVADAVRRERIRRGVWHDGRIDTVAGNGLSELGMGIEPFGPNDEDPLPAGHDLGSEMSTMPELNGKVRKEREYRNAQDVGSLPVVVIKNFSSKAGKEEISNALADWAAGLILGHVAHVIVVSDNRENAKRLAKALPTKPLGVVALADADPASSLTFIKQKLKEGGVDYKVSVNEEALIERLGGRASDLETIIHKVQAGQSVEDAVEDLIQRGVAELRKSAFGDDSEDAKGLSWTRQQAWTVLKLLAQKDELQYYHILVESPFKGDEGALRAMQHAELISITTVDGRPSTIRPGKPIHRYVFQRLLADKVFQATQDIAVNELIISGAETVIKSAEAELDTLKDIVSGSWNGHARTNRVNYRARYLTDKMCDALKKIERFEAENAGLKRVLAYGDEGKVEPQKNWWQW